MPRSHSTPRSFVRVAVDDLSRLGRITNVLMRHGFAQIATRAGLDGELPREAGAAPQVDPRKDPRDAARRFREMLEELGPTFVKVGQILSTRADLLPPPFIDELSKLQDEVPPLSFDEVKSTVEAGLGQPLEELFSSFDPDALASASIAETHLATLPTGEEVVVKVQRPGIAETIRSDLDLLMLFAKFLELTIEEMELYAPGDLVRALDEALSMELDFQHEAENLRRFAENFADSAAIQIPALFPSHCARTVLTMERIRGRKLAEIEGGSKEGRSYVGVILDAYYDMIFTHGLFHADPHPGNAFATEGGGLGLIDFGLCGALSPMQQDQLLALIVATVAGDVDSIARVLIRMGRPTQRIDIAAFKAEISSVRDRYMRRNLKNIDAVAFSNECLDAAQRYRIGVATEYALLAKCGATLDGIIRRLDPDFDVLMVGQEYARRMISDRYATPRVLQEALSSLMTLTALVREVPDQLSQVLMDAERGGLQLRLDSPALDRIETQLNTQTTRVFLGFCCAALTIATPLFLANEPWWWRGAPLATLGCALTATFTCWLGLGSHLFAGRPRKLPLSPLLRLFGRSR